MVRFLPKRRSAAGAPRQAISAPSAMEMACDVIALGWGRTLTFAINALPRRPIARTTVVSMLGGLTPAQPLNPTGRTIAYVANRSADAVGTTVTP